MSCVVSVDFDQAASYALERLKSLLDVFEFRVVTAEFSVGLCANFIDICRHCASCFGTSATPFS